MDEFKNIHTNKPLREPGRRYAPARSNMQRSVKHPGGDTSLTRETVPSSVVPEEATASPRRTHAGQSKPALQRTTRSTVLKRQMVARAKEHKVKERTMRVKHMIIRLFVGLLIVAALLVLWSFREVLPFSMNLFGSSSSESTSTPEQRNQVIMAQPSSLSENPISEEEIASNQVASDAPKVLKIPSLNVQSQIKPVGATFTNEPVAPANIFDAGWFTGSGKPGELGAVLLTGHSSGPTKAGLFNSVRELSLGDKITIEKGDGTVLMYTVVKVRELSSAQLDMRMATNSFDATKPGLNIVTALTKYSGDQKRVIIFAVL